MVRGVVFVLMFFVASLRLLWMSFMCVLVQWPDAGHCMLEVIIGIVIIIAHSVEYTNSLGGAVYSAL